METLESDSPSSSTTNVKEDALSKVFGRESKGRIRGMGKGMNLTKLSFLQTKERHVIQLQEEQIVMKDQIKNLEGLIQAFMKSQASNTTIINDYFYLN